MIEIYQSTDQVIEAAALSFVDLAEQYIAKQGRFSVALAGGSTPAPLYEKLATPEFQTQVNWDGVHLFWGDERCVPPDHPDSNFGMVHKSLIEHIPIPPQNIHMIDGKIPPEQSAQSYDDELHRYFTIEDPPLLDLVLLGLGEDGHTASLFPNSTALAENDRWAIENFVPSLDAWRITLTASFMNMADHVFFLVTGDTKAEIVNKVIYTQAVQYPAQLIQPISGNLVWMLDMDAASKLQQS